MYNQLVTRLNVTLWGLNVTLWGPNVTLWGSNVTYWGRRFGTNRTHPKDQKMALIVTFWGHLMPD